MTKHTPGLPQKQCIRKDQCVNPLGSWLPATTEYFYTGATRDGLRGECIECRKTEARKRQLEKPDEIRQSRADYYKANKPLFTERSRKRRQTHGAIDDERVKAWVKANPERRKKIASKHASSEKGAVSRLRRRAREKELPDTFTAAEWTRCLEWWGNCCAYCGKHQSDEPKAMAADHYIPLVSELCPGTIAANMLPTCQSCNSSKHDFMPDEWIPRKRPHAFDRIAAYFASLD